MIKKLEKVYKEYLWDAAVDGGTVGVKTLKCSEPTGDSMEEGFIVQDVMVVNEEALSSTGTPTVTVGTVTDPDGFMVDAFAKVDTLAKVCRAGEVDGALIWDSTADAKKGYRVPATANSQKLAIEIGTAIITEGKLRILVEGVVPGTELPPDLPLA